MSTWLVACVALFLVDLSEVAPAAAQWGNSRGGPERDGARTGVAELPRAQVSWRHQLGGPLTQTALWSLDDPIAPRLALVNGGRVSLKRWDDTLRWSGELFGLTKFVGDIDIDGDGQKDLLLASGGRNVSTVIGYSPEGIAAFTADPGIITQVGSGTRVADLDGDGIAELYITSTGRGPDDDIAVVYRFPGGAAGSAEIAYTIKSTDRDYSGGFSDVIAELDGTAGREILALGHRSLYVYDAATGALESSTVLSGPVPFARATLRVVDLDGDGRHEVFALSNQGWTENNNRRHVTLLAHDGTQMAEVWARDLGGSDAFRLAFNDSSIASQSSGASEVVFAVRDASGVWTTEIRDSATGALLATIDGERFHERATTAAGTFIFTADDDTTTKAYRYDRVNGISFVADIGKLSTIRCREPSAEQIETLRYRGCVIPIDGIRGRGLIFGERIASGAIGAIVSLDTANALVETARFDGRGGTLSATIEIAPGHDAVLAIAHSDGVIFPLNDALQFISPDPKPPFSWFGVRYGSLSSGVDLPAFPLALGRGPDQPERIVSLFGPGQAMVLDASGEPSVAGGAEVIWSEGSGNRLLVDPSTTPNNVVVLDSTSQLQCLDGETGQQRWTVSDAFSAERPLHSDPVVFANETQSTIWYHRAGLGTYDLTTVDLSNGQTVFSEPALDQNDSGWKRLSLATWDGLPAPLSGRLGEVWRYDESGAVAATYPTPVASVAIPVTRPGENPLLIVDGLLELSVYDPNTETTLWSVLRNNNGGPRRGALLNVGGRPKYATADAFGPLLRIFDVESGAVNVGVNLVAGQMRPLDSEVPNPAPNLANVTAITDLTGNSQPAYLVGSSDGFIYAIDALAGTLLWSLDVDAEVGEIIAADWDGDGLLELVASGADGTLLGLDTFTGAAPEWVIDISSAVPAGLGPSDDIDELATVHTLYAAWAPVEGATGYEVAVFTNDNIPVTVGFANVGTQTFTEISSLPLENGVRYIVSVRAISALGTSADAPSDGVTVLETPPVTATGCCQVSPTRGDLLGNLLLAFLGLALVSRRRRNRAL